MSSTPSLAVCDLILTSSSSIETLASNVRHKRRHDIDDHPRTPDPYEIQSKRAFDGRIKVWRRALHVWDSKGEDRRDESSQILIADCLPFPQLISSRKSHYAESSSQRKYF